MKAPKPPDWTGMTVAVIGSGPSLTTNDLERVRLAGWPTIVTNRTWERAPWASILFAHDLRFWLSYGDQVEAEFPGRIFSIRSRGRERIEVLDDRCRWFTGPSNSGAAAICVAVASGARQVVLLGMDCQAGENGAKHWHSDYRPGIDGGSNAASMPKWPAHFLVAAKRAEKQGVQVVNCSRATALTCFPREDIEDVMMCGPIAS